jgi:hypothetical protein
VDSPLLERIKFIFLAFTDLDGLITFRLEDWGGENDPCRILTYNPQIKSLKYVLTPSPLFAGQTERIKFSASFSFSQEIAAPFPRGGSRCPDILFDPGIRKRT